MAKNTRRYFVAEHQERRHLRTSENGRYQYAVVGREAASFHESYHSAAQRVGPFTADLAIVAARELTEDEFKQLKATEEAAD